MKKLSFISIILSLFLSSCGVVNNPDSGTGSGTTDTTTNTGDDDNDFVEEQTWSDEVSIVWNGSTATVEGNVEGVSVSNSNGYVVVTSTAKHVEYVLSGTGSGQAKFYSDYKFKLTLSSLTLSCTDGPAINNQGHKSCYVVLVGQNSLSDGSSYLSSDEDQKATIFSEGQLLISGSGSLTVKGNYKHAIATDDYLRLRSGSLTLTASGSDGIHSNDGIIINDGSLTITAANEGMQCDTSSIVITGGTVNITSAGDKGILAYSNIDISDGTIVVNSVDKGIKSQAGNISISGGSVSVTTTGDDGKGILAKLGSINISDGTINVKTSGSDAKGIKSVSDMTISGGDITVICSGSSSSQRWAPAWGPGGQGGGHGGQGGGPGGQGGWGGNSSGSSSPEGIESKATLTITGGKIYAQSSDDAINSAGDMTISGGYVCAYSTGNDGLDANGNCYIKGGVVYAICSGSPEVAIDANTEGGKKLYLSGGTVIAIGGLESGSSLTQTCYQGSWNRSTWYALYSGNDLIFCFLTPSSGGSGMVISTPSTPSLRSGVSLSNGTSCFNGMGSVGASVSGGSNVSLSSYSGGNSGGGGGRW